MNEEKITRQITAMISGTSCNFNCDYCYRKAQGIKEKSIPTEFTYSVEYMLKALTKKRLGGISSIVVIGGGETLLNKDVVPFIKGLLKEGHVVEVVTNLTLTNRIDELLESPKTDLERLIVKGSLHYLELKKLNKVDEYFSNMKKIIDAGASSFPFLVVDENYIPLLDEIKEICLNKIGILPHMTGALDFTNQEMKPAKFYTEEFKNMLIEKFDSGINKVFNKFLELDPKESFCYAGDWSFVLDTQNGNAMKCFYAPVEQNIFKDINEEIKFEPIANNCCIANCALHYNLTTLGIMPEFKNLSTYAETLYRENAFNPKVLQILQSNFTNTHKEIELTKQCEINADVKTRFTPISVEENNLSVEENNPTEVSSKKITLINKIRLTIYKKLKKKLERKGIL